MSGTRSTSNSDIIFTREMGYTHADFFRTLPAAIENKPHVIDGKQIIVMEDDRSLTITLAPETQRKIASLQLPVTQVTFYFSGYSQSDVDDFMQRFELYFRRGGG